jgi:hypothetical protein
MSAGKILNSSDCPDNANDMLPPPEKVKLVPVADALLRKKTIAGTDVIPPQGPDSGTDAAIVTTTPFCDSAMSDEGQQQVIVLQPFVVEYRPVQMGVVFEGRAIANISTDEL